jgi:NAD-dependent deacetylase
MNKSEFKSIIESSNKIGVLTGAGISTNSGIPDFRGPDGIYTTKSYDPIKTFDLNYFLQDPTHFYKFSKEFLELLDNARPTPAHNFLYEMEKQNKLSGIITQNIDGLHQKAGNKKVIEIHGSYNKFYCTKCQEPFNKEEALKDIRVGKIPQCHKCNGLVKPNIVFFQEPVKQLNESILIAKESDIFLVIGTSLQISPANIIPQYAHKVIIINNEFPPYFNHPDYVFIETELSEFFEEYK